jgi:hypothetical protein
LAIYGQKKSTPRSESLRGVDFLGEYEAICKTSLGRESGP